MLPTRLLSCVLLVFALVQAAVAADVERRWTLKEGNPRVTWLPTSSWALAPGYPKVGGQTVPLIVVKGESVETHEVPLPAEGSVVLRFEQKYLAFPDLPPENTVELTISATRMQMRTLFNNNSSGKVEQYDFDVALTQASTSYGRGEAFELTASGTATKSVDTPYSDAQAGIGVGLFEHFSGEPELSGFSIGDRTGPWVASGTASQKRTVAEETDLDWAEFQYEFDVGPRISLRYSYTREPRPAIVFIPGVAGTALSSRTSVAGFEVWPLAAVSDRANLALQPDGATQAIKGSSIRVDGLLRSKPTNFYGGLIDFLDDKGYEENKDLYTFPYDWRLDNRAHFAELDRIVKNAARDYDPENKRKVVLIAHSMGGIIARAWLLSDPERRKYAHSLITIATPYYGAPKVFYGFADGYSFGNPTVRQELMKVLIQNFPAGYQLVPWVPFVQEGSRVYSLEETYGIRYRGYSGHESGLTGDTYVPTPDTPWFMHSHLVAEANAFRQSQGSKASPNGVGVPHHVIIGTGVKTLSRYEMHDSFGPPGLRIGTRGIALEPVFLDGDGTVPLWSLEIAGATRTYYVPYADNFDFGTGLRDSSSGHGDLPADARVQAIVGGILDGKPPSPAEYARSTDLVDVEGVDFALHSNANLTIEGDGGRLGLNADGSIDESLPTGSFLRTSNGEYASIAKTDRTYTAVVDGTGTGSFSLDVVVRRAGGAIAYGYPNVAVQAGTQARVTVDPRTDAAPPLAVTTAGTTVEIPAVPRATPAPLTPPDAGSATTASAVPTADWSPPSPSTDPPTATVLPERTTPLPSAPPPPRTGDDGSTSMLAGGAAIVQVGLPLLQRFRVSAFEGAAPLLACPYTYESYRGTDTVLTCRCTSMDANEDGPLYGIDDYTDDSLICRAALHAGAIGADGGDVQVRGTPGREQYPGSERNGVTSEAYDDDWPAGIRVEAKP